MNIFVKMAISLLVIGLYLSLTSVGFAKFVDRYWYSTDGVQNGGHMDFMENTTPNDLDPHTGTTGTGGRNQHFNGLIKVSPLMDGIELDLAESWSQPDPLTYIFKLRKGVRFQNLPPVNGRELTSADVKYSLRRMAGLEIPPAPKSTREKKEAGESTW